MTLCEWLIRRYGITSLVFKKLIDNAASEVEKELPRAFMFRGGAKLAALLSVRLFSDGSASYTVYHTTAATLPI